MHLARLACALLGVALASPALAADPAQAKPAGQLLFEQHGCTNCHGAQGVHPTSRYAPVLSGKPADYLLARAGAIFSGQAQSGSTHYMHEQFCVGEAMAEGCYPVPSSEDLREMVRWLSAGGKVAEDKRTQQELYVSAMEAYDRIKTLGEKALFLDVRTRGEVAFLGMPTDADANIPYMTDAGFKEWDDKAQNFKLVPNGEFVRQVEDLVQQRGLAKDSPIFVMCRSGNRSAKAANVLHAAGFTQVYNIVDGFEGDTAKDGPRRGERVVNGWRNSGLPWSYKLDKAAMR